MGGRGSAGINITKSSALKDVYSATNVTQLLTISSNIRQKMGIEFYNKYVKDSLDKKYKELKEDREITSSTYERAMKRTRKRVESFLGRRR